MTAKEARLQLERANASLRVAVQNALEMKAAATEVPASLERVAQCLETIAETGVEGELALLRPQLELMKTRMERLQTLLDAAAAFYCASVAKAREASSGYDSNGNASSVVSSHQLQLDA